MFKWTQSALKDFERQEVCPRKWKAKWIDHEIESQSSDAMDMGKYFEYLAIGAGARAGDEVTDLPRNKNGSKTANQLRIEEQADICKSMFDPKSENFIGIELISVQLKLENEEDEKGTLDFLGKRVSNGKPVIGDLKLTADVENTRGNYGWGNAEQLDFTQQIHYHNLFVDVYDEEPETLLLVFDYSPRKGIKHIELQITDSKIEQVKERFTTAKEVFSQYTNDDWEVYDPSESECADCPLKCKNRFVKPLLQKESIIV